MANEPIRPQLPQGARVLVALVVLATGIAVTALGIHRAGSSTEPLAILAIPAGLAFVFGGVLVLAPAKWQLALAALMITSLAAVFDWVAFGPGPRQFTSTVGVGAAHASASGGEYSGRTLFGLFAVLFDIAAVGLWIKLLNRRKES